jgi:hypothetical protein
MLLGLQLQPTVGMVSIGGGSTASITCICIALVAASKAGGRTTW